MKELVHKAFHNVFNVFCIMCNVKGQIFCIASKHIALISLNRMHYLVPFLNNSHLHNWLLTAQVYEPDHSSPLLHHGSRKGETEDHTEFHNEHNYLNLNIYCTTFPLRGHYGYIQSTQFALSHNTIHSLNV